MTADMGNLDIKLESYFKLSFVMTKVGNLDAILGAYFELFSL